MNAIDTLWHDVLFATRLLRKSPVFAAAVVLTFAIGVGVNAAVFSVVNAIILRRLPLRNSERLVVIASQNTSDRTLRGMSFPDVEDYRAATADVFEDIAGYSVGFLGLAPQGGVPNGCSSPGSLATISRCYLHLPQSRCRSKNRENINKDGPNLTFTLMPSKSPKGLRAGVERSSDEQFEYYVAIARRSDIPGAQGTVLRLEDKPMSAVTKADINGLCDAALRRSAGCRR